MVKPLPVAHLHDFTLEIFQSGVGAAVLAALPCIGWSVHVGQKRDFINPQGVDDEFTMKPTLDENGRLIPREDYRISSLNCGGEDFAVACMRANLRYEKNQKREDVKSHHYIISFDPRDGTDNGLTVDRAQELGEQFCKEHFPGHQALVCTHPDGHNHSGNIHVHIVINSLRIYEVPLLPYMDRPADTREGCKHRCTNAAVVMPVRVGAYKGLVSGEMLITELLAQLLRPVYGKPLSVPSRGSKLMI